MGDLHSALPQGVVHGLQDGVGQPLAVIGSDLDAVSCYPLDEVQHPPVLHQPPHPLHHHRRLQALVKVVDVQFRAPARPLWVISHPLLDAAHPVVDAPAPDAPAAPAVHAPHHHRLQHLHQRVVDVLVRPQPRLVDVPPFPGALVPSPFRRGWGWVKALQDDLPQFLHPLRLRAVHPRHHLVRLVVWVPAVGLVHLVDGEVQVFISGQSLEKVSFSFHGIYLLLVASRCFHRAFRRVLNRVPSAHRRQGPCGYPTHLSQTVGTV